MFNACDGACRRRTPISNLLFIKETNLEVGSDISLLAGGNIAAYSSSDSASGGDSVTLLTPGKGLKRSIPLIYSDTLLN